MSYIDSQRRQLENCARILSEKFRALANASELKHGQNNRDGPSRAAGQVQYAANDTPYIGNQLRLASNESRQPIAGGGVTFSELEKGAVNKQESLERPVKPRGQHQECGYRQLRDKRENGRTELLVAGLRSTDDTQEPDCNTVSHGQRCAEPTRSDHLGKPSTTSPASQILSGTDFHLHEKELLERMLALRRIMGAEHPDLRAGLINLAAIHRNRNEGGQRLAKFFEADAAALQGRASVG
ncbi:hypothetical protein K440DRAFT_670439 [Wilcoxina mikolae CBS 423.85]|nr:hypothetical protein K440DRAFT_670439 [Wilcoxina mikolae CBS 423.85]